MIRDPLDPTTDAAVLAETLALRDAALVILKQLGDPDPDGDGYILDYHFDPLLIRSRESFRGLPQQGEYGLEIWLRPHGKKFEIEWDDVGTVKVLTFERGAWEAEIIEWAANLEEYSAEMESERLEADREIEEPVAEGRAERRKGTFNF